MRMKMLASVLAFVLALLLSGYIYLCSSVGQLLRISEFTHFSSTIVWNSILHRSENGGSRSLQLAKTAMFSPLLSGSEDVNEHHYVYPLPKYCIRQGGQSYLTFSSWDELQEYLYHALPDAGWRHVDQLSASHFFRKDGAKMMVTTHFYLGTGISDLSISIVE